LDVEIAEIWWNELMSVDWKDSRGRRVEESRWPFYLAAYIKKWKSNEALRNSRRNSHATISKPAKRDPLPRETLENPTSAGQRCSIVAEARKQVEQLRKHITLNGGVPHASTGAT
jgi:hypothetical protein